MIRGCLLNFPRNSRPNLAQYNCERSELTTSQERPTQHKEIKLKNRNIQFKPASIAKTRWVSYAAAGAATALAGSPSAEAAIHYSGPVNEPFLWGHGRVFQLDQIGDAFRLERYPYYTDFYGSVHHRPKHLHVRPTDRFSIFGIVSAAFRGVPGYVSQLSPGQTISMGNFVQGIPATGGDLQGHRGHGGIGFIGFRFNNGAGVQYGWARIKMKEGRSNNFTLLDYAYADPGERLTAGQTSQGTLSDEQAPNQGSLGWLALGAVGLLAWRKSRKSLTARIDEA